MCKNILVMCFFIASFSANNNGLEPLVGLGTFNTGVTSTEASAGVSTALFLATVFYFAYRIGARHTAPPRYWMIAIACLVGIDFAGIVWIELMRAPNSRYDKSLGGYAIAMHLLSMLLSMGLAVGEAVFADMRQ